MYIDCTIVTKMQKKIIFYEIMYMYLVTDTSIYMGVNIGKVVTFKE